LRRYGVKARAAIGAGVSFGDMLSDAYMAHVYFDTGRPGTAYALLGMVGGSLFFQAIIVLAQNRNIKQNKWKTILIELLSIITFVKPGETSLRCLSTPPPFTLTL
jgi:hypothetical protein